MLNGWAVWIVEWIMYFPYKSFDILGVSLLVSYTTFKQFSHWLNIIFKTFHWGNSFIFISGNVHRIKIRSWLILFHLSSVCGDLWGFVRGLWRSFHQRRFRTYNKNNVTDSDHVETPRTWNYTVLILLWVNLE